MQVEEPYFMKNKTWFYFDEKEHCLKLTEEAPPEAVESYKEFYDKLESLRRIRLTKEELEELRKKRKTTKK